jgi:hypothetical protein
MTNNNTQGTDMISRIRPAYLTALAIACLLWAATASATDKPVAVQPTATATANGGYADSYSTSEADATALASQTQTASASTSASASNVGNTQVTSYHTTKQAPNAFAAASNATVACFKPRGVSASIPGVGAGFSAGKLDRDCLLLTAADEELRRGNLEASIRFRCATKVYQETLGEDCVGLLNTQTVEKGLTKQYVNDTVERAFKASQRK